MKRLVEFPQEDGTTLVVEIDEAVPDGGVVRAARPGEIAERASQTFEAALSKVKPMASAIFTTLRDLDYCPEQIQVEFGARITANAGASRPRIRRRRRQLQGNPHLVLTPEPTVSAIPRLPPPDRPPG